ncbi:MAG: PorP/SprF family type IX secretion system membrane protein [Bacteroidia bacterium]|nr:PorP/SprF family type IX secretion system membrane protein [Bacteroidia bacterium]
MKKAIHRILFMTISVLTGNSLWAQDPQLSQFYSSQLYTNPAFAGEGKKLRLSSSIRNQYTALKNNYKTTVFSIDGNVPKFNGGLGLLVSYDQAGDGFLQTISVSGIYAYNMQVNRNLAVNAAIQASIVQRSYDVSRLRFGDQLNEMAGFTGLPSDDLRNLNFQGTAFTNLACGILAYSNGFYGGIAVHNMLQPNQSFLNVVDGTNMPVMLPRRSTVHGGVNLYMSHSRHKEEKVILSPNILFMQQQNFYQVNLGLYLKKQILTVGAWLRQTSRNSDAVILLVGLRLPAFKVGYSYDATISKSRTSMGGSHELSMVFQIKTKSHRSNRSKLLKCPDL